MFDRCSKLTILDLSNFSINKVALIYGMFMYCSNMEYINLYNFHKKKNFVSNMFYNTMDNLAVCINRNNSNEITPEIELNSKKCSIIDCSENWRDNKKRLIKTKNICIDRCYNDDTYKYEYNFLCYEKCPKDTHNLKDNLYYCVSKVNECFSSYPFISLRDNACLEECNSEDFFNNICTINNFSTYQISQTILINTIIYEIKNGSLNKLLKEVFKKQKDIIKIEKDTLYQITSSFNQINVEYQKISTINFAKCEKIIKEKYDIPEDEHLIIFKIEQYIEGISIPLIQYDIFIQN